METRTKKSLPLRAAITAHDDDTGNLLNYKQLAEINDMVTELIVDHLLDQPTQKIVTNGKLFIHHKEKLTSIMASFKTSFCYEETYKSIYEILKVEKKMMHCEATIRELVHAYLKLWDNAVGATVEKCYNFSGDCYRGVKLVTTKCFKKHYILTDITGLTVEISTDEEQELRSAKKDFSILNCPQTSIFLGPIAYINHNCKPNCEYIRKDGKICIKFMRNVACGEEVTTYYSKHYFGRNNVECECATCFSRKNAMRVLNFEINNQELANVDLELCVTPDSSDTSTFLLRTKSPLQIRRHLAEDIQMTPKSTLPKECGSILRRPRNLAREIEELKLSASDDEEFVTEKVASNAIASEPISDVLKTTVCAKVPVVRLARYNIEELSEFPSNSVKTSVTYESVTEKVASNSIASEPIPFSPISDVLKTTVCAEAPTVRLATCNIEELDESFSNSVYTSVTYDTNKEDSAEEPFQSSGSEYQPSEVNGSSSESDGFDELQFELNLEENTIPEKPFVSSSLILSRTTSPTSSILSRTTSLTSSTVSSNSISLLLPVALETDSEAQECRFKPNSTSTDNKCVYVRPKGKVYKKQSCPFCKQLVVQLPRHLVRKHLNENSVAEFASLPKKDPKRLDILESLRKRGNFVHNCKVLVSGSGNLVVKKRPDFVKPSFSYIPCPHCLGFYSHRQLYRHSKICKRTSDGEKRNLKIMGRALLPSARGASDSLKERVLSRMKNDEITEIVNGDPLILRYGSMLCEKFSDKDERHLDTYISTKMRELARLLKVIKDIDKSICNLSSALRPQKFDVIVNAVRKVTGYDESTGTYEIPTLASKSGHALLKCVDLEYGDAARRHDVIREDELSRYKKLHEAEWNTQISKKARKTLYKAKFNRDASLPLAEDCNLLAAFLKATEKELFNQLSIKFDYTTWFRLSQIVLVRLITFNRRRAGEVSRLTLENFSRSSQMQKGSEIFQTLTPVEQVLVASHFHVETRGKRGRKVPIIIPSDTYNSMHILLDHRKKAGVPEENPYFFATRKQEYTHGSRLLTKLANEAGAKHPEYFKSTNLRKHVATMSQVMNLRHSEMDTLANFMGHDPIVHRAFYKMPDSVTHLAKLSKLLLAMESGGVEKYKGKNFDDICLDLNTSEALGLNSNTLETLDNKQDYISEEPVVSEELEINPIGLSQVEKTTRKKAVPRKSKTSLKKAKTTRVPWSVEETDAIKKHLNHFIQAKQIPGKIECLQCIQAEPSLQSRTWKHIKYWVKNQNTRK